MRRFLLISPLFPPHGGSGVQRSTKLAGYAPEFGWKPHVIAMRAAPYASYPRDEALASEVSHVSADRTRRIELRHLPRFLHTIGLPELGYKSDALLPVDGFIGWVPFALRAARRAMDTERFDAVMTTSWPYSAHLVGAMLKHQTGIPWLADFRDPWSTNELLAEYRGPSALARYKRAADRRVERELVQRADAVTVVVDTHRHDLITQFDVDPARAHVIYNGFDERDFADIAFPIEPNADMFRVSYLGNFFAGRDENEFLPSWRAFLDRIGDGRRHARFRVVGQSSAYMEQTASSWADVADTIECAGYVPHREVPDQMRASSVLLALFPTPWAVSGKLFEYLRAGLPVFAVVPERGTVMERMLDEATVGSTVLANDAEAGADALVELYRQWESGRWRHAPSRDGIERYGRRAQAGQFAELFSAISR